MTGRPVDVLHTAVATAENGRDGRVVTDDGRLDVVVDPLESRAAAREPTPSGSPPPGTASVSGARSTSPDAAPRRVRGRRAVPVRGRPSGASGPSPAVPTAPATLDRL